MRGPIYTPLRVAEQLVKSLPTLLTVMPEKVVLTALSSCSGMRSSTDTAVPSYKKISVLYIAHENHNIMYTSYCYADKPSPDLQGKWVFLEMV